MKLKIVGSLLLFVMLIGVWWLISHAYVIIDLSTGVKIMAGVIISITLAFFVGRWSSSKIK